MHREHQRWYSPSLGRDMDLLVFGHSGARVVVFPTSMGRYFEWEDQGMMQALGEHLERGWIQLFCLDSVDEESWYAKWKHPGDRAWRHLQYEQYVLSEVLPFSQSRNPNPFAITAGASFGAYHAVNMALRHPHLFGRAIGLSGLYDNGDFVNGHSDANVFANNPSAYVTHEHDWGRLEAMRRLDIILAIGRDDPSFGNNEHLSRILWEKGIGNALRVWDGWAHDWPWWRQMIQMYIGGSD
jgi:esterase/lipase superfamily enzyme